MSISFTIEAFDKTRSWRRRGKLTTDHGVIHTPAVIPYTQRGFVNPLTNEELIATGCQAMGTNVLPFSVQPGMEALKVVGGLQSFLNWPLPLISFINYFPEMKKVKKNAGRLGVRYIDPDTMAQKRLTSSEADQWQSIGSADLQLPLFQNANYYAPVNDLTTALQLNLAWRNQSQSDVAVITGAGLRQLRQQSVKNLDDYSSLLISELPSDNLSEWQRIVNETVKMLPSNRLRLIVADDNLEIRAALNAGVDIILSADPIERAHRAEAYQKNGFLKFRHQQYANDQKRLTISGHQEVSYSYLHYLAHLRSDLIDHILGIYNWSWLNHQVDLFRQAIN